MNDNGVYEENTKKSLAGRIMRWSLYGIMVFVMSVIFLRLFSTCEPGAAKKLYLNDQSYQMRSSLQKDFKFYQINIRDFITGDGLYHISYAYYLESTNRLQLTVRNKQSNLSDPKAAEPRVYELSNQDGEISQGVYVNTEYRFNYRFDTIIFDGIYFDADAMFVNREEFEQSMILEIFSVSPRESVGRLTVCDRYASLTPKNIMNIKAIRKGD